LFLKSLHDYVNVVELKVLLILWKEGFVYCLLDGKVSQDESRRGLVVSVAHTRPLASREHLPCESEISRTGAVDVDTNSTGGLSGKRYSERPLVAE